MDADILIVFVQDVLKLVYVWNLNVVEHRNIMASIWYWILQIFASILRRFCVDFRFLRRFSTLKVGLRPKSWNSSSLNLKSENPFIYWDSRKFPLFSTLGARTDSNRRHSEPQSDALTNWTTGTIWIAGAKVVIFCETTKHFLVFFLKTRKLSSNRPSFL